MEGSFWKGFVGMCASLAILAVGTPVEAADPTNGGYFQYQLASSSTQCAGAWGGTPNNGTQVIEWGCHASTAAKDQAWYYDTNDCLYQHDEAGDTEYCSIRNGANFKKCMGTYAGSTNTGTFAVEWDCLGTAHQDQYWHFETAGNPGDGTYTIWNLKAQKPLGDAGTTSIEDCSGWWIFGSCTIYLYVPEEGLATPNVWRPVPATP